jgi:hypothetical protein
MTRDPRPGDAIVVRTPDRREFRGRLLEVRTGTHGRPEAVVRLDTGWVTAFPLTMISSDPQA